MVREDVLVAGIAAGAAAAAVGGSNPSAEVQHKKVVDLVSALHCWRLILNING